MLDWIYQLQLSAPSHLDDDERAQDSSWVEQSFDILDDIAGRGGGDRKSTRLNSSHSV